MATWKTRGLRGSLFEELINRTNEKYREQGLALIQKIPTPITPIQIDKESRHITLAYFNQKSTVDYIGVVQGIPLCFDAKDAFFLIYYTHKDQYYYLPFRHFYPFWERAVRGGRKSFRMDELDPAYIIPSQQGLIVPYLDMVNRDLLERQNEDEESAE